MRALLLAAFLVTSPLPVLAQETTHRSPAANIVGNYTVEGRNPDGSAYSGTVQLSQQQGQYRVLWSIAGTTYTGMGRLDGRVLTVAWQGDPAPVVYVVMPNGELHGTWSDGYALDRLAPMR